MTTNLEIFNFHHHSDILDLCNDINNYSNETYTYLLTNNNINTFYNFLIKHIDINNTLLEKNKKNNEYDSDSNSDNND